MYIIIFIIRTNVNEENMSMYIITSNGSFGDYSIVGTL